VCLEAWTTSPAALMAEARCSLLRRDLDDPRDAGQTEMPHEK
jgi:hypothetical protein